jgi:hypothetical protein
MCLTKSYIKHHHHGKTNHLCRFIVIYYSPAWNSYLNALSSPPQDYVKYYIVINTIKEEKISASPALTAKTFKYYFLI